MAVYSSGSQLEWREVEGGQLPSQRAGLRATLVDNVIFVTGGWDQALTGTRYPTLPGFYFYYPYPTRKYFKNFRVQGSNYTCCFQSRIISMMPANQLRGERNSLKIGKIFTTSTHTLFRNIQVINWQKCRAWTNTSSIYNEYSLILVQKTKKRRKVLTFFFVVYIKVTWSSVGMVMFSWVNFSRLRLSTQQMGPEPTFDGKCGPKNSGTTFCCQRKD